ncbi:MAG: hypothetical protein ACEPOV_11255 [Hyphomicrobiales bacterium]
MNISFENWLNTQVLSSQQTQAFKEAFLCYRIKAYRASLLFSWIGFMMILKDRVLKAKMPDSYKNRESKWNDMLNKLHDDEKWEKATIESVMSKAETNKVFNISELLRNDVDYWKNRRNDCAHFKDTEIDFFHVNSFWSFLQSNLKKITVLGGEKDLIKKIKNHFDPVLTNPNSDILPLIEEVFYAVVNKHVADFWRDLFKELSNDCVDEKEIYNIIDLAFTHLQPIYYESLIELLKRAGKTDSEALFHDYLSDVGFLCIYPQYIGDFSYDEIEIREIWKRRLYDYSLNYYGLYYMLLEKKMIADSEIEESYDMIIEESKGEITKSDFLIRLFENNEFMKRLEDVMINWLNDGAYNQTNVHSGIIIRYLEFQEKLNTNVIKAICFRQGGDAPSRKLKYYMGKLFREEPAFFKTFTDGCKKSWLFSK